MRQLYVCCREFKQKMEKSYYSTSSKGETYGRDVLFSTICVTVISLSLLQQFQKILMARKSNS